jgi:peptidoglycan/LPS O-acetylase OafA/YrhL
MTKFRYDINALRALAVTAVVLFHYNVNFVPGGFAGVDIFFVISGYLMTDIIVSRMQRGRFKLSEFYFDRAKRIVPGLAGLCFGLLAIGYFIIDPINYNKLSYSSVSALLFYSNIIFYQSQGYFDPSINTQWLLHTWSLSVEWQFYMLYPLALIGLCKIPAIRRRLVLILAAAALASLALCVWRTKIDQPAAFYLLAQRAWEMAAGGVVALKFKTWAPKRPGLLLAAGFSLIAVSLFCFDKNTDWPSYQATVPVIGACLVIAANQGVAWPFRLSIVQTLGRWSYSIYLWHWPVAVAFAYFNFRKTTVGLVLAELAVLAAIIFGGALLLLGAKRLAGAFDGTSAPRRLALAAGALAFGFSVTLAFALTVDTYRGFANRTPAVAKQVEAYKMAVADWDFPSNCDGVDEAGDLRPCRLGQASGSETLIIGDSFAMQIFHRLEAEKTRLQGSYTFLTSAGCTPLPGIRFLRDTLHCNGFFEKALNYAAEHKPNRIVVASNWISYFDPANAKICFLEGDSCALRLNDPAWYIPHVDAAFAALGERLRDLRERGAKIVIVSTTPYGPLDVPSELLKRQFLGLDTQEVAFIDRDKFEKDSALTKRNLVALAMAIGAKFIEPVDFLCGEHLCPTIGGDSQSYFRDKGHYRAAAVRTDRFRFFDEALGINEQYSSVSRP